MSNIQSETERTAIELDNDGSVKSIIVDDISSISDVQAGIEFIYNMREHMLDIGIATVYLISCYAIYLWLKKVIK
jgi:hypothetical protein|tara:strand:+ start:368 stop:592 length:225 start_codon:yes stop_codon:yes gene_type:complete